MAQEIINTGAAPNDGDGDNLRTAFTKVNNNFTQVWTAGPVGSNVQIQGNTIFTLQVNQDLALSPNGTGNVRLNNNTIPGANNTWFLGSVTNRWRGLFVGNVTAGNVTINDGLTVPGDAYIGGNLTVVGNTIQIGNITTDTKTIQLANTATTDSAANGSGITVGANDDIATFLYDAGNNVWTTNIGLQVDGAITGTSIAVSDATIYGNVDAINGNFTGNVTANYFIGDGSQLSNITGANVVGLANVAYTGDYNDLSNIPTPYGNSNVATLLAAFGSNTIVTTGNITAGYFLGNGSQLTGIQANVLISNAAPAVGNGFVWWNTVDGRAYIKYNNQFIDLSPSLVPDPTTYVGNVSFDDITVTNVGNIIPAANATYSLGSAAFQWSNLWVANNTIYLGGVPLGVTAGNVLTIGGEPILSNDSNTSITTTGNLTANIITATESANLGSLNFYASVISMNDDVWDNIFISPNGESYAYLSVPKDSVANVQNTRLHNDAGNVEIGTNGGINTWLFDSAGDLTAPGNISTTGNIDAPYIYGDTTEANVFVGGTANITGNVTAAYFIGDGSQLTGLPPGYTDADVATFLAAYGSNTISTTGNVTAGNFIGAGSNVDIVAGAYDWTFGNDGNLLLPGNTFAVKYANGVAVSLGGNYGDSNVVTLLSAYGSNTISTTGNITAGNIITNGYYYANGVAVTFGSNTFSTVSANGTSVIADSTTDTITYTPGNNIVITGNATTDTVTFAVSDAPTFTGNVTAQNFIGNISVTGNVTGTSANVDIIAGSYQWTFNNAGNLVLPGNTFSVNYANGTAVSLGGAGTYGDPNVVTLMAAFGSNTITTTGNVASGNLIASGNISFTANTNNLVFNSTAYISGNGNAVGRDGSIMLVPYTGAGSVFPGVVIGGAGRLIAPNGSVHQIFNTSDVTFQVPVKGTSTAATSTTTGALQLTGGAGIGGNIYVGGLANVTGNITGGNLITTGNVSGNVSGFAIGYRDIPVLSLAANTTISTSDAGKQYYSTSASPLTLTIANNASQGFQLGATINIINQGAGNVSVLRDVGVTMYLAGNSTSSDRTLTSYGVASVTKVATDTWFISGVGLI